jgi:hypothetical protein
MKSLTNGCRNKNEFKDSPLSLRRGVGGEVTETDVTESPYGVFHFIIFSLLTENTYGVLMRLRIFP